MSLEIFSLVTITSDVACLTDRSVVLAKETLKSFSKRI